ncbi:MAG: hypothetical protein ABSC94_16830 [Polyangiaceae bacterium]
MTKPVLACSFLGTILFVARPTHAQENQFLCCDSVLRPNGSCLPRPTACADSSGYAIGLENQPIEASPAFAAIDPSLNDFPGPGPDGYMFWQPTPPWFGLCLDAPSPDDPNHAGPTEPIGCLSFTAPFDLWAETAVFQVPNQPEWDAYQLCYGPPSPASPDAGVPMPLDENGLVADPDGGLASCAFLGDLGGDLTSLTPFSGSCCQPPQMLMNAAFLDTSKNEWQIAVDQGIPGIVPPYAPYDGGCTTPDCGQPPPDSGFCTPTTCQAQGATCATISDGCGGTLSCFSNCSAQEKGCSAAPGTTGDRWWEATLLLAGLPSLLRRRRHPPSLTLHR